MSDDNKPTQEQIDSSYGVPDNDEIQFAEETELNLPETSWKILIVDDDVEVHDVTKLALSDVTFEGKSLTFISAYSAAEAKHLIQAYPDTAIVFLDVVMETENAGLEVIHYIREELGNLVVRIILRTGQPGQAPENVVVMNYGIEDYKTKTELTARKLFITVITALRTFSMLTQLLEISLNLEQKVTQHEQTEAALRQSEKQGWEKARQLERSLQIFQQNVSQSNHREQTETLGHLVTEMMHEMANRRSADTFYTMSMITRFARMALRITDEHSARLGISQSKLTVLIYLSAEPDRCASPSALAKHCGVSRAAMTGLLDGLEQEGYVERDDHPSDRRALMVKLTEQGQTFLEWLAPQDQYQVADLMNSLDEAERQNLMRLVMQVSQLLRDQTAPFDQ